jgi:glycosyltransferase involved in cell wall biosynthesis
MKGYPKISIVTPNYNCSRFLEETILSVIKQDYPNLEYIIIDGGSTDGSIDIIKKYENKLASWVSEPDNGMYHAIQKGFDRSTGEIMGWINSDDILQKSSLDALAYIFSTNKAVDWVQGYPNVIDEKSNFVYDRPPRFSKFSFYLKDYHDGIFIQQESTFWRRKLWTLCGGHFSEKIKYAGDFELWIRFFQYAELYTTKTRLGSFRVHHGQMSKEYYDNYILECDRIISETKKTLIVSVKFQLFYIWLIRKIRRYIPRLYKLLYLDVQEYNYLAKLRVVDYNAAVNHFVILD